MTKKEKKELANVAFPGTFDPVVINRLIERWRVEEKMHDDEILFMRKHNFEFETKVQEEIQRIVSRRREELERILGL